MIADPPARQGEGQPPDTLRQRREFLLRLTLRARPRGYHLFIRHTSASLLMSENASPEVRGDFERFTRELVPDGWSGFRHTLEGPDDMSAHIKASLFGPGLTLPVRLHLGTWQGIYLAEHRDEGGPRSLPLTLTGE